jgi:FAD/FMN-containing dehydrogenase
MNLRVLPTLSAQAVIHQRPEKGSRNESYEACAQQYASSSMRKPERMRPALIIIPGSEDDILKVVLYAKAQGVAVALRSGGHAFNGGSSTGGDNIQLDLGASPMSKTWEFDAEKREVTLGTGWSLGQVEKNLQGNYQGHPSRGYFFAHGNCAVVRVGGHMHTGGISMQSRSFGLFVDFVERFTIITADGQIRKVRKPDEHRPDQDNDDIFWAVLGGGPGSFGIVTQVTVRLLHNDDFPESRAYMQSYVWTKKNGQNIAQALFALMARISDEDKLPADFCLNISQVSATPKYFSFRRIAADAVRTAGALVEQALEKQVRTRLPGSLRSLFNGALRAYRSLFGSANGRNPLFEASMVPAIIVQASWNNLSGQREDYDDTVRAYFDELDAVALPSLPGGALGRWLQRATKILSPSKHLPITEIIDAFTFKGEREYDMPYIKRNWAGYEVDLGKRSFSHEASKLFSNFTYSRFSSNQDAWQGNAVVCGCGYLGGTQSKVANGAKGSMASVPHRQSRIAWMSDYYYAPEVPGAYERLMAWVKDYDRRVVGSANAFFCERDARYMFDPFDTEYDESGFLAPDLGKLHEHFYDSPQDYARLQAIKKRFDPQGVFSATRFTVGPGQEPVTQSEPPRIQPNEASPHRLAEV